VAGVLSLILPGTGHYYAGRRGQGVLLAVVAVLMVALIFWVRTTHELELQAGTEIILVVSAVAFWIWSIAAAVSHAMERSFLPTLGLVLVLIYTYVLGWQVTEVNLVKFFTEFSDIYPIFTRVMWPWDAAVEYDVAMVSASTKFANPCPEGSADLPPQTEGGEKWVTIDPACGEFAAYDTAQGKLAPGTLLTLRAGGFTPNTPVDIYWVDALGNPFRPRYEGATVTGVADAQGNVEIVFGAPQILTTTQVGVQLHTIEVRQELARTNPHMSVNMELALNRIVVTIFQALMATSFGIILAVPFSFVAARNLMGGSPWTLTIYYLVRLILNIVRSIEPIIWAVIAVVWVGLGPFAGVIALTLHTIASLGKLYSEAIESIEPGPIEAITATGASPLQIVMYAIIPQVIPPFVSFTIYRWDINVRMSTIIGFVGGGGIGQLLYQWITQAQWSPAGLGVWLIALTVTIMDYASAEIRKRYV
jgi:phosphonate transport system permease protein